MLILALVTAVVAAARGLWSPCGLSMLSSLNPVAERGRGHRPALTAAWYVLGASAGGVVLGGFCAVLAAALSPVHLGAATACTVAAAAAVITVGSDARTLGRSLPDHPRQVNEQWLSAYRRWVYAAGFGAQIGTGFATYIMTAATYLTAALAVLAGPRDALVVGIVFGVARGAEIVLGLWATTPQRLGSLMARVDALATPSLTVAVGVQVAVAAIAAGLAGGAVTGAAVGLPLAGLAAAGLARHRAVPLAA